MKLMHYRGQANVDGTVILRGFERFSKKFVNYGMGLNAKSAVIVEPRTLKPILGVTAYNNGDTFINLANEQANPVSKLLVGKLLKKCKDLVSGKEGSYFKVITPNNYGIKFDANLLKTNKAAAKIVDSISAVAGIVPAVSSVSQVAQMKNKGLQKTYTKMLSDFLSGRAIIGKFKISIEQ